MTISPILSRREKRLRKNLINDIPKFPNDRATRIEMEGKSTRSLLLYYTSWRLRLVSARPRKVLGKNIVRQELKDQALINGSKKFIDAVERGDDLTLYLSDKATKRGYTPPRSKLSRDFERWNDKDFLLNTLGFHHFHIGDSKTKSGLINRTNQVIFAKVNRTEFHVIGVFDHSVFNNCGLSLTLEQKRLWETIDEYENLNKMPSPFTLGGYNGLGIATSGHPIAVVMHSNHLARIVRDIGPKLDNTEFVTSLGFNAQKAELEWCFSHSDFGLLDKASKTFRLLQYGLD